MKTFRSEYPIRLMARVLGVSASGFYRCESVKEHPLQRSNEEILQAITTVFLESHRTYGSPRILASLKKLGFQCGKNKVAALMKRHGIKAKMKKLPFLKRRFAKENRPFVKDHVKRNFLPLKPNKIWASDITFIWTKEGWIYLAVVMDLWSRKIIGYELSERPSKDLSLNALKQALKSRLSMEGKRVMISYIIPIKAFTIHAMIT